MPLTPADVHNVAFKKPPIGKRGYDEEEVDAFLDLIEVELAKLIEENSQYKAGVAPAPVVEASEGGSEQDAAAIASLQQHNASLSEQIASLESQLGSTHAELEQARQAAAAAEQAAQEAIAAAQSSAQAPQSVPDEAPAAPLVDHSHAVKVLALAQQTADQHLAEAAAEAQGTIAAARAAAEQLTAETKAATEGQVGEAQLKADQLDRDSKAQAQATIQDAEQRRLGIVTQLEQQRDALEKRLEELRTFEREYRTRLKSYLESQLRDLDGSLNSDDEGDDPQS
jgi:DivIVA domain-containing protein